MPATDQMLHQYMHNRRQTVESLCLSEVKTVVFNEKFKDIYCVKDDFHSNSLSNYEKVAFYFSQFSQRLKHLQKHISFVNHKLRSNANLFETEKNSSRSQSFDLPNSA